MRHRILFTFILFLVSIGVYSQTTLNGRFNMLGQTGTVTNENTTQYRVDISGLSDQSGASHLPTDILVNDVYVDSKGDMYTIESILSAFFTSAVLLVAKGGNTAPIGQSLITSPWPITGTLPLSPTNAVGMSPTAFTNIINHNMKAVEDMITSTAIDTDTNLGTPVVITNGDGTVTATFPEINMLGATPTGSTVVLTIPAPVVRLLAAGTGITITDNGSGQFTFDVTPVDLSGSLSADAITLINSGSTSDIIITGGDGLDIVETATNRYTINGQIYTTITATNYADAAAQGVAIGEYFIAAIANSMGAIPGSFIRKMF